MTIKEIMNMNPSELSDRDLNRYTVQMDSAANKRIKRLRQQGLEPTALIRATDKREKFSVKNKTREQVINEFNDVKQFLSSKVSTVRGAKKETARIEKETGLKGSEQNKAKQAYFRIVEENPELSNYQRYLVYRSVSEMATDGRTTARSITARLNNEISKLMEEDEEADAGFNYNSDKTGVSQFF